MRGEKIVVDKVVLNKHEIIESLDFYLQEIKRESYGADEIESKKIELYKSFCQEIKERKIPDLSDAWFYKLIYNETGFELRMCLMEEAENHFKKVNEIKTQEEYVLLKTECEYLTVEQFAEIHGVSDVTVRQWIRRGKLRYAKKMGGEWFVPEVAEKPERGYSGVEYKLLDENIEIGGFPIASYCKTISIYQDESHSEFICCFTNHKTRFFKEVVLTRKEVEALELALISSGKVKVESIRKKESISKLYDE